jgi:zinc protease
MVNRAAVLAVAAAALAATDSGAQDRVAVRVEPGTPVVALEVLVTTGPADETAETAGLTYLTARSVTAPVRAVLDSLGAHLSIEGHKDAVSFTVISAPEVWREASQALLVALFRDPVDSVATVAQRREIAAELTARQASPADELVRRMDAAIYGGTHPWGRPTVGTAGSVGRLTVAQVDGHLRRAFTADRAVVAAVGPLDYEQVVDHLRLFMDPGPLRRTRQEASDGAPGTVRVQYNTITAWVAAAYRFDRDSDVDALRMLAEQAIERLSFGPQRPSVYDARAEVVRHGAGGELRLHLVVPPDEADLWADRLHGAVREFAERPLSPDAFAERLRRHRGERLLELSTPEARARALARGALLGSGGDDLAGMESLTPERVHAAARGLSAPVRVILGPFVDEEEDDA